jgi:hypothetical protein
MEEALPNDAFCAGGHTTVSYVILHFVYAEEQSA